MRSVTIACALLFAVVQAATPPNVIVMIADDVGWFDVGFHGSDIPTPNIDKLAAKGVELTNYHVQEVCSPTRTSTFTGRYPIRYGLLHHVYNVNEDFGLYLNETGMSTMMKRRGYDTAFVGKHHMGSSDWAMTPRGRDFDSEQGFYGGSEDHYFHNASHALDYHVNSVSAFDFAGKYSAEIHGAAMVSAIEAHAGANEARRAAGDASRPFFGWFAFQNCHAPQQVPQSYVKRYNGTVNTTRREEFAGMMIALDDAIGNVTDAIEANGLSDNLVIVWTSDNGAPAGPTFTAIGGSNIPYRGSKHTLWEGGVKGAGFVYGTTPELQKAAGTKSSTLMHAVDWFPTVIGLTGQPIQPNETLPLDGVDQYAAILNQAPTPPRSEILHNYDPLATGGNTGCCGYAGLRRVDADGDWKLLVDPGAPDGIYPPSWVPSETDLSAVGDVGATMTVSEMEWARLDKLHTAAHGGYAGSMSDSEVARLRDAVREEAATWAEWGRLFASLTEAERREQGMLLDDGSVVRVSAAANRSVKLFQPMSDITEANDLASQYPAKVSELTARLQTYIDEALPDGHGPTDPRSDPGKQGCPEPCWQPWLGKQP